LEAVEKAQQLHPDFIMLDIGMPRLNGIEAARRIRKLSPESKILFLSENRSWDIAEEALRTGAGGYVVKSDAASELLPAVEAVLSGKRFVSSSLHGHHLCQAKDEHTPDYAHGEIVPPRFARQHEVEFYSDDQYLLDELTQFIGAALRAGNAAIVVATDSHRKGILPRLQAYGVDVAAVIEQGRYIVLDASDALSTFMVNGALDSVRFMESFGKLILKAASAAGREYPRVAFFGEGADVLWKRGNAEAAIQDEKLCNQLIKRYDVDMLCGYSMGKVHGVIDTHTLRRISAEHSAVHSCCG
jgi:CheY-like chemotaxis protein